MLQRKNPQSQEPQVRQRRALRWLLAAAAASGVAGVLTAAHSLAGDYQAHWRAPCPPGSVCMPRRVTYGYYPTLWRQWPGEPLTIGEPEKRAPVVLPDEPEKPTGPDEFDDMGSDEEMTAPVTRPQTRTRPEDPDLDTDMAPMLPDNLDKGLPQPGNMEELRNSLQKSPADDSGLPDEEPPAQKKSPANEDTEDPFLKDDEDQSGGASMDETGRRLPTPAKNRQAQSWRTPKIGQGTRESAALKASSTSTAPRRAVYNSASPRNPLRASATGPTRHVLPAADWSTDDTNAVNNAQVQANPLRR